jgi:hypothetical protein
MKLPRVLFTVRRMMIAVAVVCLFLGAENFRRRRAFCLRRANYHRYRTTFRNGDHVAAGFTYAHRGPHPSPPDWGRLQYMRQKDMHVDWHWRLAERYERAATLPWLATPSEPPCPGW